MRDEGYFCSLARQVVPFALHSTSPMYGKFKFFSCLIFLLVISQSVTFASNGDRLDSIGVQKIGDRTFILHQVVGQETLFSISRRYKVPMVSIQEANEALKQGMKDGQTLLIPFGQPSNSEPINAASAVSLAPAQVPATTQPETRAVEVNSSSSTNKVEGPVEGSQSITSSKPTAAEPAATSSSKATVETTLALKATHKIARGESLFSVAKKYKVTIAELKEWNSLATDKVLVGQSLKILATVPVESSTRNAEPVADAKIEKKEETKKEEPKVEVKKEEQPKTEDRKAEEPKEVKESTSPAVKETNASSNSSNGSGEWTSHTVKSGESLFSLSKQYGTSIEDLIQWNALTSNNLKVGQSIKVGRAAGTNAVLVVGEVKTQPTVTTPAQPTEKVTPAKEEVVTPNTSGGFTNTKETGLAEMIPGTEANKKYLVLHRTAPVGSVIRVKNEENNLTIFARVVGVLPETGDNSKILIKLSQAAFEQLKGVNARFPVEVLY
jgi:LysM repeat protein